MKKIMLALICLLSIAAFSQNTTVDVIIDGKPAKLNKTSGVYTFTKGSPSSYKENKPLENPNLITSSSIKENIDKEEFNRTIHVVSKGETIYAISKKYGISIAHIKSINEIKSNIIDINQKLKIGYSESAEIKETPGVYKIKNGDTLYSIARQHNLTVQELKTLNNIESNIISIGQELTVK